MKTIAISLIFILVIFPLIAWALSVDDVAGELVCNCGCGKLLNVCEMKNAKEMKKVIQKKIEQGWSKERILEYFMRMYGEEILAAPTKKGFNLTAWITPFLAIAVGGLAIYLAIIRWVKQRKVDKTEKVEGKLGEGAESEYGEKLDKELEEFDQ